MKHEERRYIYSGVNVKDKRALFDEKCVWCNGEGLTRKEIMKAKKEDRLPIACSCIVLTKLPINFIVLPYQIGRGVILNDKESR